MLNLAPIAEIEDIGRPKGATIQNVGGGLPVGVVVEWSCRDAEQAGKLPPHIFLELLPVFVSDAGGFRHSFLPFDVLYLIRELGGIARVLLACREFLRDQTEAPWQCLYFLPLPHGQGALRATLGRSSMSATETSAMTSGSMSSAGSRRLSCISRGGGGGTISSGAARRNSILAR